MNLTADTYFLDGCGRCPLMATPQCKVNTWKQELALLRRIVLDCGLIEEVKWGVPVYTWQNRNILLLGAFKASCTLSFFKGVLLEDADRILCLPGESTQSAKLIRFTKVSEIARIEALLKAYIFEAIEVERAGLKVVLKTSSELAVPAELKSRFAAVPGLQAAFEALTPGRQRAYILYFAAPKQAKTREARVLKCTSQVLAGKGLTD